MPGSCCEGEQCEVFGQLSTYQHSLLITCLIFHDFFFVLLQRVQICPYYRSPMPKVSFCQRQQECKECTTLDESLSLQLLIMKESPLRFHKCPPHAFCTNQNVLSPDFNRKHFAHLKIITIHKKSGFSDLCQNLCNFETHSVNVPKVWTKAIVQICLSLH